MYPIILPAIHPYQTASVLARSPTPEKECIIGFTSFSAFVFLITRWPECYHLLYYHAVWPMLVFLVILYWKHSADKVHFDLVE